MTTQLTTSQYSSLNSELGAIFGSGQYAYINIYLDSDGNSFANDNAGNQVSGRQIASMSLTDSYLDTTTNTMTTPYVVVTFSDGTKLTATDNVDNYWYSIFGVAVPTRKF